MLLAIGNGIVREATYGPFLTELRAHQLSTVLAIVVFGLSVGLLSRWRTPESPKQAALIGVTWLTFTLGFEFLFGHYVAGHSWARLIRDYDLSAGRLWPVLLVWIAVLPYLVYRVREPVN